MTRKAHNRFSPELEALVVEMYKTMPVTKIGKQLNISPQTACNILQRFGIAMKGNSYYKRKYETNEEFFDNIDSEEKAYFLGLLLADGTVVAMGTSIKLSLMEPDRILVDKLRDLIAPNAPVRIRKKDLKCRRMTPQVEYLIGSKYMVESVAKYGLVNRKTGKEFFPDIPETLESHFIRGYFDGDGGIYYHPKGCSFTIISGPDMLEGFFRRFEKIGLNRTKTNAKSRDGIVREIRYGGSGNIRKLYNYLYKDATVFLPRKKLLFEKCIHEFL
jgi:hypothetical protein